MKKFILTAAMGVLLFVGLTSMASAPPPPYDCASDCAFLTSIGLFPTNGACMSACRTCTNNGQGANRAVCECKLIDALYGLENLGVNFGQCVNIVKGN
jgi:hypothetical protein